MHDRLDAIRWRAWRPVAVMMAVGALSAMPAAAQTAEGGPRRTRVTLGPELVPAFPGADRVRLSPLVDVSRARGDDPIAFEAPDESAGFALWQRGGFAIGPALNLVGRRLARDTDGLLPTVGRTVELGGSLQYAVSPSWRLRTEVRQGIGGHRGFVASLSADYVMRDADRWLFSVGPRVTLSNARFDRAYFGVSAGDAARSGLGVYRPGGGVQAVGVTAGFLRAIGGPWGLYTYARYDRLVGDDADSPVTRRFGSRSQPAGGIGLSYTFGGR
ncbi:MULTISPECIES: MipA/OmpV family protein [Sphingomonas]|uniref:MipA/OmpV family protein n=1 Tax=Sphingomonas TaxID=13687 RepID=UPI00193C4D26|nr:MULTISPECIES: MipA/OmpV family protein [Sphingomonas]